KEWNRQRDALSAERRKLPMVRIEKDYVFEGPNGRRTLGDLFEGSAARRTAARWRSCATTTSTSCFRSNGKRRSR
ncbi:MAG: DUF899 domain-containing protein, partial [Chloroflexi bacterium]